MQERQEFLGDLLGRRWILQDSDQCIHEWDGRQLQHGHRAGLQLVSESWQTMIYPACTTAAQGLKALVGCKAHRLLKQTVAVSATLSAETACVPVNLCDTTEADEWNLLVCSI